MFYHLSLHKVGDLRLLEAKNKQIDLWNTMESETYIYMCVYLYICMYVCMYKTGISEIDSHLIYNKDNEGKYLGKSGLFTT